MDELILLGTLGCHLCEEAESIIQSCDLEKFSINQIDIAEHEQWQEKYAIRIPVLLHSETGKELGWPFNDDQLRNFIRELND